MTVSEFCVFSAFIHIDLSSQALLADGFLKWQTPADSAKLLAASLLVLFPPPNVACPVSGFSRLCVPVPGDSREVGREGS